MSGYCADCGNTACICPIPEMDAVATLEAENQQLRALLTHVGSGLETALLWDGTLADPKLSNAYRALNAYREWRATN